MKSPLLKRYISSPSFDNVTGNGATGKQASFIQAEGEKFAQRDNLKAHTHCFRQEISESGGVSAAFKLRVYGEYGPGRHSSQINDPTVKQGGAGIALAQITFYVCFPLLLLIFIWGFAGFFRRPAENEGG